MRLAIFREVMAAQRLRKVIVLVEVVTGTFVQAIGNTPLVELPRKYAQARRCAIWAKLESHNPTGSVKDRVAPRADRGRPGGARFSPVQTILEPTSGNTGISLAMICSRKGYRLKVVMPLNVTPRAHPAAAGCTGRRSSTHPATRAPTGRSREGGLEWPRRTPSVVLPYQYGNQANPLAHYNGTAARDPRRARRGDRLRRRARHGGDADGQRPAPEGDPFGDAVKIVAAEPMQGRGEPVQGLRSLDDGFIPPIIDISLLDRKIFVTQAATRSCGPPATARRGGECSPVSRAGRCREHRRARSRAAETRGNVVLR